MDAYISKPIQPDALFDTVAAAAKLCVARKDLQNSS